MDIQTLLDPILSMQEAVLPPQNNYGKWPEVLYHGFTSNVPFQGKGPFFFTDDPHYAGSRGKNIVKVSPRLKNPDIQTVESGWSIPNVENELIRDSKMNGHDGLILINPEDGDQFYVIFSQSGFTIQ